MDNKEQTKTPAPEAAVTPPAVPEPSKKGDKYVTEKVRPVKKKPAAPGGIAPAKAAADKPAVKTKEVKEAAPAAEKESPKASAPAKALTPKKSEAPAENPPLKSEAPPESAPVKNEKPTEAPVPPQPPDLPEAAPKNLLQHPFFSGHLWKNRLRPIAVLTAICLLAGLLLGIVNIFTAPRIAENAGREMRQLRLSLLPGVDSFEEVEMTPLPAGVTAVYKAENGAGYVIEAFGEGFKGPVPVMVGINAQGVITGVRFLENDETPGLGDVMVTDPAFAQQFVNRTADPIHTNDVDAIAQATVSTVACIEAVNAAIACYRQLTGKGGA